MYVSVSLGSVRHNSKLLNLRRGVTETPDSLCPSQKEVWMTWGHTTQNRHLG